MGVHSLWSILQECGETLPLTRFSGQTLCIDVSVWISQAMMLGTGKRGFILHSKDAAHLRIILYRVINMLSLGIKLIAVTDGAPPSIKVAHGQRINKKDASLELRMVKRKGSPFPQQTREVVSLLTGLGIPVLSLRVGEAEAACAYLCRIGIAQGCITSDADAFLFGAPCVLKSVTACKTSPMSAEVFTMDNITQRLGLGRNKCIALSVVLGSDYVQAGISHFGPVKARQLLDNWNVSDEQILDRFLSFCTGTEEMGVERQNDESSAACSIDSHTQDQKQDDGSTSDLSSMTNSQLEHCMELCGMKTGGRKEMLSKLSRVLSESCPEFVSSLPLPAEVLSSIQTKASARASAAADRESQSELSLSQSSTSSHSSSRGQRAPRRKRIPQSSESQVEQVRRTLQLRYGIKPILEEDVSMRSSAIAQGSSSAAPNSTALHRVVEEYLQPSLSYDDMDRFLNELPRSADGDLLMRRPDARSVCTTMNSYAHWAEADVHKCLLPLVLNWDLRNYFEHKTPYAEFTPVAILKKRVLKGVIRMLLKWRRIGYNSSSSSAAATTCENEIGRNDVVVYDLTTADEPSGGSQLETEDLETDLPSVFGSADEPVSEEPRELLERVVPHLVLRFDQNCGDNAASIRKVIKKVCNDGGEKGVEQVAVSKRPKAMHQTLITEQFKVSKKCTSKVKLDLANGVVKAGRVVDNRENVERKTTASSKHFLEKRTKAEAQQVHEDSEDEYQPGSV